MKAIRALIVDDEALDRELIKNLIRDYCQQTHVVAEANSVESAKKMIAKHQPNVLFLDIEMPTQNGFELLEKSADRNFLTIITTGYDQYGIRAVKAGAFDYLLKPIDVDELLVAEQKIVNELQRNLAPSSEVVKVFHQGEQILIKVAEIVSLKAQGSYTLINLTSNREILTAKNLNLLMSDVRTKRLVRVHRSFVVNLDFITSYQPSGNEAILMLADESKIPVSRTYKSLLKTLLP